MLKKASLFAACALPVLLAQDAPKAPTFLAADVHMAPTDTRDLAPGNIRGDQYELRGMTMLFILQRAYGMDADHILGGPRRIDFDKYDITAKVPPGTKIDAAPAMLKALLADRFRM